MINKTLEEIFNGFNTSTTGSNFLNTYGRKSFKKSIGEETISYLIPIPGSNKEDISIELKDGYLVVPADSFYEKNDTYTIKLSSAVESSVNSNIIAEYINAILEVKFPRVQSRKTINIL